MCTILSKLGWHWCPEKHQSQFFYLQIQQTHQASPNQENMSLHLYNLVAWTILPQKYQSSFQQLYIEYIEKHYIFTIYLQYCLFYAALLTFDYKRGLFSGLDCRVTLANWHTRSTIHETHFLINQHKTHLCNSILALCIAMTWHLNQMCSYCIFVNTNTERSPPSNNLTKFALLNSRLTAFLDSPRSRWLVCTTGQPSGWRHHR